MKNIRLKVLDIVIIVTFVILSFIPWVVYARIDASAVPGHNYLSIQKGGEEIKRIKLTGNKGSIRIPIVTDGKVHNLVEVVGEQVHMLEANCPDQLCVKAGFISKNGQTIVCLPNKVVLEIKGDGEKKDSEVDINAY